jgi:GNAT superfamily N-acetyltransferase
MAVTIKTVVGEGVLPYIAALARLRIAVFREFPYLYDGKLEYEAQYLQNYSQNPAFALVLAVDTIAGQETVVGASTAMPLIASDALVQQAFAGSQWPIERGLYYGESVLELGYRGQGVGLGFFAAREAHARALGLDFATFCAVVRPSDHPRRPIGYVPLDDFWHKRGFNQTKLTTSFSWQDIDEEHENPKEMVFWLKGL